MTITLERLRTALAREAGVPLRPEYQPGHLVAAVALVVRPSEPPDILLIRRATSVADPWSAHMAFPGGKLDQNDENLLVTAMREAREEVGVDLSNAADYLGPLPIVDVARHGRALQIHPFVFALTKSVEFRTNYEVDGVFWVALDSLVDGSRDTSVLRETDGNRFRYPAWDVEGNPVWGLTYRMLRSLLTALEESPHE